MGGSCALVQNYYRVRVARRRRGTCDQIKEARGTFVSAIKPTAKRMEILVAFTSFDVRGNQRLPDSQWPNGHAEIQQSLNDSKDLRFKLNQLKAAFGRGKVNEIY